MAAATSSEKVNLPLFPARAQPGLIDPLASLGSKESLGQASIKNAGISASSPSFVHSFIVNADTRAAN